MIEYVLVNFYKLKKDTQEFKMIFEKMSSMARDLATLVKIPMVLTACCCLWYEEFAYSKQSNSMEAHTSIKYPTEYNSVTHTFLSLVDSMIRRADEKCDLKSTGTGTSLPTNTHSKNTDQVLIYSQFLWPSVTFI